MAPVGADNASHKLSQAALQLIGLCVILHGRGLRQSAMGTASLGPLALFFELGKASQ